VTEVKVRRSHRVECVVFPSAMTFSVVLNNSEERSFSVLSRQDAFDSSSPDGSCSSNPFSYIHYYSPHEDENQDSKKPCLIDIPVKLSDDSSFDVAPVPDKLRGYEDLSSLGKCRDSAWTPKNSFMGQRSLSVPKSFEHGTDRCVSLDPRLVPDTLTSEKDTDTFLSQHEERVPWQIEFADPESPRSSDSGLADVARSECDCPTLTPYSTPRTSEQPNTVSTTVTSCFVQLPETRQGRSCTVVKSDPEPSPPGVFRSAMYAHWWAKCAIPPNSSS